MPGFPGQQASPSADVSTIAMSGTSDIIPATQLEAPEDVNSNAQKATRFHWTPERINVFVGILINMTRAGRRSINGWKKVAWTSMTEQFNRETGCTLLSDTLKNKERDIKKSYTAFKKLLENSSGWAIQYEQDSHRILCDDTVWQDYIKHHPEARELRDKPFLYYRELVEVYDTAAATGWHAQTAIVSCTQGEHNDHQIAQALPVLPRLPLANLSTNVPPLTPVSQSASSMSQASSVCASGTNNGSPGQSRAHIMQRYRAGSVPQSESRHGKQARKKQNLLATSMDNAVQQIVALQSPIVLAIPSLRELVEVNRWKKKSFVTLARFINKEDRRITLFNTMENNAERSAYLREEWLESYPYSSSVFDEDNSAADDSIDRLDDNEEDSE